MADILSQDEIDQLLNAASGLGGGSSSSSSGASLSLDPGAVDSLNKLAKTIFASANATMGVLLAKPAKLSEGEGSVVSPSSFTESKYALLSTPFRSGLDGQVIVMMDLASTAALADLVLGGDGAKKDELEEADIDAAKEAVSQILGNVAPQITSLAGVEVGFGSPVLKEVTSSSISGELGGDVFCAEGRLSVTGSFDSRFYIIFNAPSAQAVAAKLAESSRPEPAPQQAAQPAPRPQPEMQAAPQAAPFVPQQFSQPMPSEMRNIDLILDIDVEVVVRLGNAEMPLRDIQKLRPGSIIDLDKDTESLVELVVNNRVIAKGELVVVGSDHFALRVTEIQSPYERIRSLGSQQSF